MTTTPVTPSQEVENAYQAYYDFGNNQIQTDTDNFNQKLNLWCQMVDGKEKSPEVLLMLFWTMIVIGGNSPQEGLAGDGSSVTHNQENSLVQVGKEMNYATGYRDVATEIKNQIVDPATGTVQTVTADLAVIDEYRDPSKFNNWAPSIFQNSDSTFKTAETNITTVLAKIDPSGHVPPSAGYEYSSFQDLVNQAQSVAPGTTNDASNDLQTFMNGTDGLLSAVSVQQNVLGATMQDTEANYKSILSSDTQAVTSLFSIIDFVLQHFISN
jgi:hypothetical protein